jgi:methylmalonic aciduria homocystinuria type C protein
VSDRHDIVERLQRACAAAGLDLVHPFGTGLLAEAAADERLQDFGRGNALGVLIGNTRALWPAFTRAYGTSPPLRASPNPLDTYVSERVAHAAASSGELAHEITFAHVVTPRAYPVQRLAERSGFAAIAPCHLVIHREHGLWLGLRAVITFDCDGPPESAAHPARPCDNCSAPCVSALEHAAAVTPQPLGAATIRQYADAWIDVRRVCPVGQASRYGEAQLRYHYVHDPALIRAEP